jgi:transcriptional regulator with XRE-family HTH domain
MEHTFGEWLDQERTRRGWSQSELARRGKVSPSAIQQVISGVTRPGPRSCQAIALALEMPPDDVYRLAGLLPPRPKPARAVRDSQRVIYEIDSDQVLLAKFHALNPDDQALVRGLIARLVDCDAPRIIGEPDAQT